MPEFDMDVLAENLRVERARKGLTQEQAAADAGIRQSMLSSYERAASIPGIDALYKLCMSYGKTLNELCGYPDAKHQA